MSRIRPSLLVAEAPDVCAEERDPELEDRAEIHELLYAYARCADTEDWDAFAGLFVDGGYLVLPFGRIEKVDMARTVVSLIAN